MNRVRMLLHFGVRPYLVFDGDYLPGKSGTEKDRAARRRQSKKNGLELLRLGKTAQAHLELQKSIDVTPEMACLLIEELKRAGLDYVVAPYEADAQMVHLERRGIVSAILSEDSDLLVFGAKCLLTKLDQYGECIMINRSDFTACREISLVGWTDTDFRHMAILSGCDYLNGVEKMGLKTAYRLLRKHKTVDRLVRAIQFDGKMKVPPAYLQAFAQADATFLYQWVYCPESRKLVNFTDLPADVKLDDFPCIGKFVDAEIAAGVATGRLHPHTKDPIVLPHPSSHPGRRATRPPVPLATPDLKKHKSIESFFKPTRTPLAELDPNSFTPSPSQQQLLRRNPASWSTTPIGPRTLLTRSSTPASTSASQPLRRVMTDVPPSPFAQSPKRQRLCSDGVYATPSDKPDRVESGASRFFASHRTSPSKDRERSKRRSTTDGFNLWSDDSVNEAMAQLPVQDEVAPRPRSTKKTAVLSDDAVPHVALEKRLPPASANGSESIGHSTPKQARNPTKEDTFSSGLATDVALLRFQSFTYHSKEPRKNTPERHERTPDTKTIRSGAVENTKGTPTKESPNEEPASLPAAAETIPCSSPVTDNCTGNDFEEADWQETESRPLYSLSRMPSSGQKGLQSIKDGAAAATPVVRGSEDLLVPDSEGEEEIIHEDERRASFSFDIAKFAFAG